MADGGGRPAGEGAHVRWDEMAVGHVLGGLDDVDRALFREHLTNCTDCRARVSELREMAASLEEAAAASEPPPRPGETGGDPGDLAARSRQRRTERTWKDRRAAVVTLLVLVATFAGILWLLAAVGRDSELVATARVREATLEALGRGVPAVTNLADGVHGIVVASDEEIAWSFTGLPSLDVDERIVVWFTSVDDSGDEPVIATRLLVFGPDQVSDGRLAGSVIDTSADDVRVTVEMFPVPGQPVGRELVRADLLGNR